MFPELFSDRAVMEYFARWKRRTLAIIDQHLRGTDHEKEIRDLSEWMLLQSIPGNYNIADPQNEETTQERRYENICVLMTESGVGNPKGETVYAFYSRLEHLLKKNKPQASKHGTRRN